MDNLSLSTIGVGGFGLAVAIALYFKVKAAPEGNAAMTRIAALIRAGAMAFLTREYKVLAIYALVVFGLLAWQIDLIAAASFLAAFVEEVKASGFVGEAITRNKSEGVNVAPPAR